MKVGLGLFCLGLLLAGCFEDTAQGGTDEVENPALTASLRASGGQGMAGTVRLFARYQNPVKDPLEVLSVAADAQGAVIRAKTLLAAMDSASKRGVPWKHTDSVMFNLVGSTAAEESFRADYLLLRGTGGTLSFKRVSPPEGGGPYSDGSLSTSLPMAPAVQSYKGSVGADGVGLGLSVVFVPGSPYKAQVGSDGSFTFARIAAGRYDVRALDLDGKVYQPADSLATDAAFAPADWSEADIIWIGD